MTKSFLKFLNEVEEEETVHIRGHKDNLDYNEEYDQNGIHSMKRVGLPLVAFPDF